MNTAEEMELLLSDYFADKLTEEETADVEKWISSSLENKKSAIRIYRIWQSCYCLSDSIQDKTARALEKTHGKMKGILWKSRLGFLQKAASILLIPLTFATIFYAYMYYHIDEGEWVEVKTTTGMVSCITLPDSSKVWLNSNSALKYPVRFTGRNRNVNLVGEAYFDIVRSKGRTFTVSTESVLLEVLGTEFNIDAYSDNGRDVRTTLASGSVAVTYQDNSGQKQKRILSPGEQLSYNPDRGTTSVTSVNPLLSSSWKDGRIVLENTPLSEALRLIENRYNVKFLIKNTSLLENHYTGVFVSQSLDAILEHFRKTTDIHFDRDITHASDGNTISGRQIIIVH